MVFLRPSSLECLQTNIVVADFLIFFYVEFDAKFGLQGIHVYEASIILFVWFFKIHL
jgi:hypothetical protein